jgi:hypothetical protein
MLASLAHSTPASFRPTSELILPFATSPSTVSTGDIGSDRRAKSVTARGHQPPLVYPRWRLITGLVNSYLRVPALFAAGRF